MRAKLTLWHCLNELWKLYPVKKGKGQVSDTKKRELLKIGFDEMSRAIDRYLSKLKKDEWRQAQNGSTFFNSGYIDYLDANYVPGDQEDKKVTGRINSTISSRMIMISASWKRS